MERPCMESCEWQVCNGVDTHHLFYPRRAYRSGVEKRFRRLAINVVEMCVNDHRELHATQEPPVKPSRDEMLEALNANL